MRGYDIALFIHLLGVVTLFAAFGIMQLGGARVRQAQRQEHVRMWLSLLRTAVPMFPIAFGLLVAAGLYMTFDVWSLSTSWVLVSIGGVAAMVGIGVGVIGRGVTRMSAAAEGEGEGVISFDLKTLIADRPTWLSVFALNGAAIGILWLMTNKPAWAESLGVPIVLAVTGIGVGLVILGRERIPMEIRVE